MVSDKGYDEYYDITVEVVYSFKVLLLEDLANNIYPKYDTIIIKPQHLPIFSSWIEKKNYSNYNKGSIPYDFTLLYSASRDGKTTTTFHAKCDNKRATIVVVKIEDIFHLVGILVMHTSLLKIALYSHLQIKTTSKVQK
ncbi:hypothetical protein C1645_877801 [Glomus cerebriforme]|uniref:TLDc domain-containing protein n=1 Tax=Glomus cerebriforme TaxID=658196 RepID=A0A397SNW7_9GLOM|nr:hypothetical protein C1645_877801 [Glomus cerebriforme]